MELKKIKYICNTGKLPGFADGTISPHEMMKENLNGKSFINSDFDTKIQQGSGYVSDDPYTKNPDLDFSKKTKFNASNILNVASAAPGLVGSMVNSWTNYDSIDEIIALSVPTQMSKNGVGYQSRYFTAKDGKLPKFRSGTVGNIAGATASGASMGSIAGPWGAVIGGAAGLIGSTIGEIFSGDLQARNENNAKTWVDILNNAAMDDAYTKFLRTDYAKKNGDPITLLLPGHKEGKLPKFENGLESAFGKVKGLADGMVSNGEVMAEDGYIHRVGKGKDNKDTRRAILNEKTAVFPNQGEELFGEDISDFVWRTGDVDTGTEMLKTLNTVKDRTLYAKNGKLPKFAAGWLGNAIPATFGTIAGLGQYLDAKQNKPYYPNTYSSNPYENEALTTLAGLRVNPYPIMNQLRSAEARTNRAVDIAGGLSGGQRTAARLAALNTTQNNISNLLSNILTQNNAYKSAYAQAALNAGQQSRAARMSANQWDYDMYAKAHAARNRGIQTGIANMLSQIQQYQANEFKRRQFNDTMALYRDDMDQRKKNFEWYQNNALNVNNNPDPTKNPGAQYFNLMSPYEKWMLLQNRGIIR